MTNKSNLLKAFFINLFFSYVLTEIVCFISITNGYVAAKSPSFKLRTAEIPPIADINPVWGVWHPANVVSTVSIGDCFKVNYTINSYGARDKERKKNAGTNRVIVLGDSFMEGLGVEASERVSDILEQKLNKEFLNFACSGNFGPLQSYLVYDKLASGFTHDEVWLGIFPDNDFIDDDYESGKKSGYYNQRYKPYLTGQYPDYQLTYMLKKVEDSYFTPGKIEKEKDSFSNKIHQFLKSFTYWYNIYTLYQVRKVGLELSRDSNYSGYYDYTTSQFDNLRFVIEKLKEKVGSGKLKIILIPAVYDFVRYRKEGGKGETKLGKELGAVLKEKGIPFYDLLPDFYGEHPKDFTNYYITCDRHWNASGNRYAAELLIRKEAISH